MPPLRIGLTGGIGSGKSTVAELLVRHGAALIDTDALARELTQSGGAAVESIRDCFGSAFIDPGGSMDRERMRDLAFADPQARRRLEAILHPLIGAEAERRAAMIASPVKLFDVPLLAESGHWRAKVDRVIVVDCREDTQVDRVVRRSGWSREAVLAVVAQQAERASRRACADAVIYNDGLSLALLALHVESLWVRWCGKP
jgi:dephospho-CoA kinase